MFLFHSTGRLMDIETSTQASQQAGLMLTTTECERDGSSLVLPLSPCHQNLILRFAVA